MYCVFKTFNEFRSIVTVQHDEVAAIVSAGRYNSGKRWERHQEGDPLVLHVFEQTG